MHIDVSRAYFLAKAPRPVLIRPRRREDWPNEEEHVRYEGGSQQLGTRLARASQGLRNQTRNLFHHEDNRVSGLTHGDDFVLTGPTKRLMKFESKMTSVYSIKAKIISYGSSKSIKTLNRRLHWGRTGILYQHDPRHVDVLVKDLGLEHGNSVQTPATADATEEEEESEPLSQVGTTSTGHRLPDVCSSAKIEQT